MSPMKNKHWGIIGCPMNFGSNLFVSKLNSKSEYLEVKSRCRNWDFQQISFQWRNNDTKARVESACDDDSRKTKLSLNHVSD